MININISNISEKDSFLLKTKISTILNATLSKYDLKEVNVFISDKNMTLPSRKSDSDIETHERANTYKSVLPTFSFNRLVLPKKVKKELLIAMSLIEKEEYIFNNWGLNEIEPFPRTVLNFYGKPGTGKTFAAHAMAQKLEKPILVATYADIESMYHGVGPKNLEAIFHAAERDNAILFIDEADSLLSKRLTNVTQGSEQAINSMRSQLLICLEKFKGISIFATNLVENYDKAFETRVKHIMFPLPDKDNRMELWKQHIPAKLPVVDMCFDSLAEIDDICGRDIKNAVISAALDAAFHNKEHITKNDLVRSILTIKESRINEGHGLSEKEMDILKEEIANL